MNAQSGDSWFAVQELGRGLFRIHEPYVHRYFRANIFLLRGRDADLVVDFGMGLRPLKPLVDTLSGVGPLIAVATHSHADHIGGFHEFSDRRAHASESEIFTTMPERATCASMFRALDVSVTRPPKSNWLAETWSIPPAPLTTQLEEGDIIDLGERQFEVLHLPGHSPGDIGLLDRHDGMFFVGDAIYDGTLVDDLPRSDKSAYRQTMTRLASLDVSVVFGGHGEPLSGTEMRRLASRYLDAGS